MHKEDKMNDFTSGQLHPTTSKGEASLSKDDTSSDDSSNGSDGFHPMGTMMIPSTSLVKMTWLHQIA